MRNVWFLLLPHTHLLDLAGPLQTISTCFELDMAPLCVRCIGPITQIECFQNISVTGLEPLPESLEAGDLLFVIGHKLPQIPAEQSILQQVAHWLQRIASHTPDLAICSICTGAFLLGQAGLLDGRRCTTHHRYAEQLQQHFPLAEVLSNHLFVQDGNLYTSAGVSTGIDLALHVISQRLGRSEAGRVAQELVIYRRRAGNDPQLSMRDLTRNHIHPLIHEVQSYLEQQFASSLAMEDVARRFNLSYRHLARLFRQNTGITLQAYLRKLRVEHAKQLLEQQRIPIESLAERCGFSSSQAFRLAWSKEMPLPPLQYRQSAATL